jgi:hypothetical protein
LVRSVKKGDLGWKLRSPCAECPFKTTTPFHEGVAADLPATLTAMMEERFAHTCHRTDPRSDYKGAKRYRGQVQHCAGALIMMERSGRVSLPMADAIASGALDPNKLDMKAPVYTIREMIDAYLGYLTKRYPLRGAKFGIEQHPITKE